MLYSNITYDEQWSNILYVYTRKLAITVRILLLLPSTKNFSQQLQFHYGSDFLPWTLLNSQVALWTLWLLMKWLVAGQLQVGCHTTPRKPVSHSISSSWNSVDDVLTLCMLKNSLTTHICVYPFNYDNVHNNFHIPKGLSNTFRVLEDKHDLYWTLNHPTIHK